MAYQKRLGGGGFLKRDFKNFSFFQNLKKIKFQNKIDFHLFQLFYVKMNHSEDHDNKDGSKKQKTTHECKLCYVEQCSATLKCGHEMCTECCIKHFRKTINCPFCRTVICEKEDRTNEYKQIIKDDLQDRYQYLDYDPIKEMTMYEFLKFKGVNKKDAREIIDSMRDRCLEMFKSSEKYTEILSTIQEEWEEQWDSESDSEYEDESEFKSECKCEEKDKI